MRILLPLLCSFILSLASCASAPKAAAPSYAGSWDVMVKNTPLGDVPGTMVITQTEEGYTGTFSSQGATYRLKRVTTTEAGLQVGFYFPEQDLDVDMDLRGAPTDNALTGQTLGQYMTTATRTPEVKKDMR